MAEYLKALSSLNQSAFGVLDKEYIVEKVTYIIKELRECLRLYLEGYPAAAYMIFRDMVAKSDLAIQIVSSRTLTLNAYTPLFRIKRIYDVSAYKILSSGFHGKLKPKDLFHVPFQNRRAIGTNRFSIPGFPCIYLSNSLHTSWSECMNNRNEAFHAICFKNHRPLYIVDLSPLNYVIVDEIAKNKKKLSNTPLYGVLDLQKTLNDYIFVFPLVFACHSKIKYIPQYPGEIQFKSEYIIPQLLMQWYRENHFMVDGVRYLSCTAEEKFPHKKFNKHNYVIPAINIKETGYCDALLNNFSATKVYTHLSANPGLTNYSVIEQIKTQLASQKFSILS